MTAAEALLKVEEQILKARQSALDLAARQPDAIGRLAYESVASTHKHDAEVCRIIRESLEK